MKKPTAKAIAAAKIAIAMENATAAEGSRNLVLLRRSPLPSPLLPAMLLSTPKKSSPQSPERGGHEKSEARKDSVSVAMWGAWST
jgi:hypothetical protein